MRGGCALAQKRYLQLSLSNASVLSLNRRCVELAKRRVQIAIAKIARRRFPSPQMHKQPDFRRTLRC
jgi:hypothetical protein